MNKDNRFDMEIANDIANGILLLFIILLVLVGSFAAWLNTKPGKKWLAEN